VANTTGSIDSPFGTNVETAVPSAQQHAAPTSTTGGRGDRSGAQSAEDAASTEQLGVELPIPAEHLAMLMLAVGSGLAQQHQLDPRVVPDTLFADSLAYLWLGVMAAGSDPSMLSRGSGTSPPGRSGRGRRRS
jgi:hypothetical protein